MRYQRYGWLSEQRCNGVVHRDQPVERSQRHQQHVDETVFVEVHAFQSFQLDATNRQGQGDGIAPIGPSERVTESHGVRDAKEDAENLGDGLPTLQGFVEQGNPELDVLGEHRAQTVRVAAADRLAIGTECHIGHEYPSSGSVLVAPGGAQLELYTLMIKIDSALKIAMYHQRVPSPKSHSLRRRTAPRKGDLREAAILDAAERQLSEGGADRITVETIATAAGITRGALYFYFGSKNDVLAALVERTAAAVVAGIESANQSAPEDPREALRRGIIQTAQSWAEHGAVMRTAVELSPSVPEIEARWSAAIAATGSATCSALMRAGMPEDGPQGARAISSALVSMTERHFYLAFKHGTSLTDAADTLTYIWLSVLPR